MTSVIERFLKYVSFDTQSDEFSETCPSTDKQKVLGAALVEEMKKEIRKPRNRLTVSGFSAVAVNWAVFSLFFGFVV